MGTFMSCENTSLMENLVQNTLGGPRLDLLHPPEVDGTSVVSVWGLSKSYVLGIFIPGTIHLV